MAGGVFIIGATPSAATIGIAAPLLLLLGRLLQGFSAGGELGSAAAYLVENAPENRRGRYAAWLQASMGISNLLSAVAGLVVTALFSNEDGGDLARVIINTLQDLTASQARTHAASQVVGRYDWSAVTDEVLDVYDMALSTAHTRVDPVPGSRTMLGRLRDALDD